MGLVFKRKRMVTFMMSLAFVLLMASTAFAQNTVITVEGNHKRIVADAEHLEILNKLHGTKISVGEVIKAVFPEAIEDIPDSTLKNMSKIPMNWGTNANKEQELGDSNLQSVVNADSVIFVGHESNLDPGDPTDFDSGSRVWLPNPYFRLPFMSVLSYLLREDNVIVASNYDYDYNVYEISTSASYYNPQSASYCAYGEHYGEAPPGYTPSTYYSFTNSGWKHCP